jgi:PAS domain S-box-containing protein
MNAKDERIAELEQALEKAQTVEKMSRDLNATRTPDEMLQILTRPAVERGASTTALSYFDLNAQGEPEWMEVMASWAAEGENTPPGTRFHLPEFPVTDLWFADPDNAQLISDLHDDPRVDENTEALLADIGIQAAANIPLVQGERWVGILTVNWDTPHEFDELETAIYNALPAMVAPVVDNRRLIASLAEHTAALQANERRYRTLIDTIPYGIQENDIQGIITLTNPAFDEMYGYEEGEAIGTAIWDPLPTEEERENLRQYLAYLMKEQPPLEPYEAQPTRKDGSVIDIKVVWNYLRDESDEVTGFISVVSDITEQKRAEEERERLQQEIIEAQREALAELSTPVIPVMERILVMPLVGSIDTMRARDIMRTLLEGISQNRAKVVILDVTGVPVMDTGVVNHINKTIQAARLKGAQTIVTGISDAVAEAIVDLGIDWGAVETLSDLRTGLTVALNRMGIKLVTE